MVVFKCLLPSQAALCQGHPRLTKSHKRITSLAAANGPAAPRESGSKGKTSPLRALVEAGQGQSSLLTARSPWHQGMAVLHSGCKACMLALVPREVASPHIGRDHQHFPSWGQRTLERQGEGRLPLAKVPAAASMRWGEPNPHTNRDESMVG